MFKSIGALLVTIVCVTGCAGPSETSGGKIGGAKRMGDVIVRWGSMPPAADSAPAGTTPLVFEFTSAEPRSDQAIPEERWVSTASGMRVTVENLKEVLEKNSVYLGPQGVMKVCDAKASQAGICGRPVGLTIGQRTKTARDLLSANPACTWLGFDPGYHARMVSAYGARDFTLHALADCG